MSKSVELHACYYYHWIAFGGGLESLDLKEDLGQLDKALDGLINIGKHREASVFVVLYIGPLFIREGEYRNILGYHDKLEGHWQDVRMQINSLYQRASVHLHQGDAEAMLTCYLRVEELVPAIGDPLARIAQMGNLGIAYAYSGHADKAFDNYERAIEAAREHSDQNLEVRWKYHLALEYATVGKLNEAAAHYNEALTLIRESAPGVMAPELLPLCLNGQAEIYLLQGRTREAIDLLERALDYVRKKVDRRLETLCRGNLGACSARLGEAKRAEDCLREVLAIAQEYGLKEEQGQLLHSIAEVYIDEQWYDEALKYAGEAAQKGSEIHNIALLALSHLALGVAHLYKGNPGEALASCEKAEDDRVPLVAHQAAIIAGIASLRQGNFAAATSAFHRALKKASDLIAAAQDNFQALHTYALALTGQMICGSRAPSIEARAAYHRALVANQDQAVIRRLVGLLTFFADAAQPDQWHAMMGEDYDLSVASTEARASK